MKNAQLLPRALPQQLEVGVVHPVRVQEIVVEVPQIQVLVQAPVQLLALGKMEL